MIKKVNIVLFPTFLLGMLVVGCQPQTTQTSVIQSETYSNAEYGFSLNYPRGWEISEEDLELAYLIDFDYEPADVSIQIFYSPLVRQRWNTLAVYYEAIRKDLEGRIFEEEQDITVDKLPAKKLTFSYSLSETVAREMETKYTSWRGTIIVFLGNGFPYSIGYIVPAEFYDNYYEHFNLIVNTFKFTK